MFETQEVWYKLLIDSWKGSDLIQQGVRFFNRNISRKDKEIQLSIALTLKLLVNQFEDEVFHRRLADLFSQYNIDPNRFNDWYEKQELNQILNGQTPAKMYSMVKAVRDNKKMHFWNNSGTMKFSTIHSFKGWESNTLFLILEPRFQNGEFNMSFDELIYTGITRSKSNLIIINHGNTDYHKELERVIRIDNPY
jgi:superfamily I DNA/RNA helicase